MFDQGVCEDGTWFNFLKKKQKDKMAMKNIIVMMSGEKDFVFHIE